MSETIEETLIRYSEKVGKDAETITKLTEDAEYLANIWKYCKDHFGFAFSADFDVEGVDFVADRVLSAEKQIMENKT